MQLHQTVRPHDLSHFFPMNLLTQSFFFCRNFNIELNGAIDNLTKLVPDENKRKFFVRVFKWVVAFATWKYGPKSAVAEMENLQATFGDENPSKGLVSSTGRLVCYNSDELIKQMTMSKPFYLFRILISQKPRQWARVRCLDMDLLRLRVAMVASAAVPQVSTGVAAQVQIGKCHPETSHLLRPQQQSTFPSLNDSQRPKFSPMKV